MNNQVYTFVSRSLKMLSENLPGTGVQNGYPKPQRKGRQPRKTGTLSSTKLHPGTVPLLRVVLANCFGTPWLALWGFSQGKHAGRSSLSTRFKWFSKQRGFPMPRIGVSIKHYLIGSSCSEGFKAASAGWIWLPPWWQSQRGCYVEQRRKHRNAHTLDLFQVARGMMLHHGGIMRLPSIS